MDSIPSFEGLNSQVPNLRSSFSFPSEPPDVGNWFSSYEYQSPDPDSNFRVKDSAFTENESQGDGEEVVEEKVRIRGLRPDRDNVGHEEEDNHNEEQGMNKNLGPFSSCSLLSEPPDIRNWFSSYVYESPEFDTCSILRDEVSEENHCEKFDFEVVKADGSKPANGYLKGCVEHNDSSNNKTKGDDCAEVKKNSTTVDTYQKKILQPCRQVRTTLQHKHGPTNYKETLDLNHTRPHYDREGHPMSLDTDKSATKPPKLLHKNDSQISNTTDIQPDNRLDLSVTATKTFSTRTAACTNNKENDGFVTTRKKIFTGGNDENCGKKPEKILLERSVSTVKIPLQCGVTKRKALTESTNVQLYDDIGITGKWQCPQKRKPDVGPAMKQLRLERWVRRL
ncbi:hypothetical protein VIGAN_10200200 [Vigna angularis var. angularis]|uniref:Uncharacterized protein n=1 Tax=Vigna angularis var. angularis TaxID=157739 RepID=A0A0S3T5B0_PHAAN|nr:uncharacterized protein LOC108318768 [Vigna angularis]BAU00411.1 hypothetical protein VIGAN_10200200 [Vigna angularis var. angularis]